ncbi:MAG: chemotaxis-specific protein-glutamate methyltransferase CheB [Bdellovibrionia bacterium]
MIKVLVVDDTPTVRDFIVQILSSDSELQVVGTAGNGEEALLKIESLNPDIVTMDIQMPKMGGIEATRRIMETHPLPIIVVSGAIDPTDRRKTFEIMEAGALAILNRPFGIGHADHASTAKELIQTVSALSEVKVVRRWKKIREITDSKNSDRYWPTVLAPVQIVAIGASTGGPFALRCILEGLSKNFSLPILVVQHMSLGFIEAFIEWLSACSQIPIHLATHGERPLPGHVYFAPDGYHLGIKKEGHIILSESEPVNGLRPSVSYLFQTIAEVFGRGAIGILLTGMGKDGADGLKTMKERGAMTIAQDQKSSIVHGMPGEAIRVGAATHILPLIEIAGMLTHIDRVQLGLKYDK